MKLYKIRKSKIDNRGRGLYAAKDITEGTKIINYLGKIISHVPQTDSLLLKMSKLVQKHVRNGP